jgi:hypothetical protein
MPDAAAVPGREADADNGPGGASVCCRACQSAACQREQWTPGWPPPSALLSPPHGYGTRPRRMKGRNWDRAAALLGEGRVFLFEDKGTTPVTRKRKAPLQTHRIDIDRAQLDWYCDEVEPAEDVPVYYVLPRLPGKAARAPATSRSRSPAGSRRQRGRSSTGLTSSAAPTCATG